MGIDFDPTTEEGREDLNTTVDEDYDSLLPNDDEGVEPWIKRISTRFGRATSHVIGRLRDLWKTRNPGKAVPEYMELQNMGGSSSTDALRVDLLLSKYPDLDENLVQISTDERGKQFISFYSARKGGWTRPERLYNEDRTVRKSVDDKIRSGKYKQIQIQLDELDATDKVNFLGISIVGQSNKKGDGGIYVGSVMKGGAVDLDGRVEPGDMLLQVNDVNFENMSNDDAVRVLREMVHKPGPITLTVAKCWDPTPKGYFTLPHKLLEVRIDRKITNWSGSMAIGVTTANPSMIEIPSSATGLKNGYWIMSGMSVVKNGTAILDSYGTDLDELTEGDRVGVRRTGDGCLHFYVNGKDLGVAASEIPGNLYGVVDLYGKCVEVSVYSHFKPREELLEVRIDRKITNWSGSMAIGVTTANPSMIEIPSSATGLKNGYWIMSGMSVVKNGTAILDSYGTDLDELTEGDRVGVRRTGDGCLHFYVNGKDLGVAASEIPGNLYGVVDLYGKCVEVSVYSHFKPREVQIRQLPSFTGYHLLVILLEDRFKVVVEKLTDMWAGSLEVGITSHNPLQIVLPPTMTSMTSGAWMWSGTSIIINGQEVRSDYSELSLESIKAGDKVGILKTADGTVSFYLNGVCMGVAADDIPPGVFGVVDLYGAAVRVSVVSADTSNELENEEEQATALVGATCDTEVTLTNNIETFYLHKKLGEKGNEAGDRVGLVYKEDGSLNFFINGEDMGLAAQDIPVVTPVYGMVDLYGRSAQATITNGRPREDIPEGEPAVTSTGTSTRSETPLPHAPASTAAVPNDNWFTFSSFHGDQVVISHDHRNAIRVNPLVEFNNAIVMSQRPLRDDEMFEIIIEKQVDRWSGSLEAGVTSIAPDKLSFPNTITDLDHDTWMLSGSSVLQDGATILNGYGCDLDKLKENFRLGIMRKADGSLHYFVNGEDCGSAASSVPAGIT
ncbi:predicted protein [Nematostella vectensis]|uniref:Uncharacterized protein n=1 Tax=Nematostella vectensis TaxID=45351 RepID=A7S9L7_NEMVE|nr:predicted protein [Nematostella vectensis]|eukprot:XP_001631661.1 predicted protein [Nematostella vectensis]